MREFITVGELVEELLDVDQSLRAYFIDNEYGEEPITRVRVVVNKLTRYSHRMDQSDPRYTGKPFVVLD